jgi:hypothetical protein
VCVSGGGGGGVGGGGGGGGEDEKERIGVGCDQLVNGLVELWSQALLMLQLQICL